MQQHFARVTYRCRNGYEWDLVATLKEQVHPSLRTEQPTGVAGSSGLPAGACSPPSGEKLTQLATQELRSSRHRDHVLRGSILIIE
jgi:hypothetical protein